MENRTRDSRREMDVLDTLEDLKERNDLNYAGVDPKVLLQAEEEYKKQLELLEKQDDEAEIKRMFAKKYTGPNIEEIVEEVITPKNTNNSKTKNSDTSVSIIQIDHVILKFLQLNIFFILYLNRLTQLPKK